MADHFLSEHYKDAAAVMIGSVLEEHLRQLCGKAEIDVTVNKDGKDVPKKADSLNAELAKAIVTINSTTNKSPRGSTCGTMPRTRVTT